MTKWTDKNHSTSWYGHKGIELYWHEGNKWLRYNDGRRIISAPEDFVVENLYRDFCDENKNHIGLATDSRFEKDYIPAHKEDIIGYIRLLQEQDDRIEAQRLAREALEEDE